MRKERHVFVEDCQIDTDLELLFPEEYISNISERMNLYRELDQIQRQEDLQLFEKGLIDRFGPLPGPSQDLLQVVNLRQLANRLGFEKIVLKNEKMIGYFVSNQDSPLYKSKVFTRILSFCSKTTPTFQDEGTKQ